MKTTNYKLREMVMEDLKMNSGSLAVEVAERLGISLASASGFLRTLKKNRMVYERTGGKDRLGRDRNVWFFGEPPNDDDNDDDCFENESKLTKTISNVTEEDIAWMRYWSDRREKRLRAIKSQSPI